MKKIQSKLDLITAIENRETSIKVENSKLSNLLILVYRMQYGLLPASVITRIQPPHSCKIAVGEGVVINVDDTLAKEDIALNQEFEDLSKELDVEEVVRPQINLYYRQ